MLFDVRQALVSRFVECISLPADCINITLPWPPSVNHMWKRVGRRVYLSKEAEIFREKVAWIVKKERFSRRIPSKPIECDCAVMVEYMPPDNRRRDIDNNCKSLLDAMTHSGVWKDDSQVKIMLSLFGNKVRNGAVEITIQPLEV